MGSRRRKRDRRQENRDTPRGSETASRFDSPWATWCSAALIVLATAAAFGNSFGGPLIFDDEAAVTNNLSIRRLWPLSTPLSPPNQGETVTGRPLLNLSLAFNYAVGGLNVWGYHAVNLTIHLLGALALFGLLRRTLRLPSMRDRWGAAATPLALAAALLWAVHPLQTESVTYIVQRAESLVGLFYLLTLYALVRGAESKRTIPWYGVSVLACLLGMASKEVMVSAPLIALLYDRTFLAGSFREALRRRWGLYAALAGTWLLLAWLVVAAAGRGGTAGFGAGIGSWTYLCTQFGAIVRYLKLSVWPTRLILDHGTGVAHGAAEIIPYAIVVTLLGLAAAAAIWRWPKIGFLGACFFAILAPTSSVVPVATQTVAEHRMYLPLAAVVVAAVLGCFALGRETVRRRWLSASTAGVFGVGLAIVAGLVLGEMTFARNEDYRTRLSIWKDTAAKAPRNARARHNHGYELTSLDRFDDAIAEYKEALALKPDYTDAYVGLGAVLIRQGKTDEARKQFDLALKQDPNNAEAHYNIGNIQVISRQFDKALEHYWIAAKVNPNNAKFQHNLANALISNGRIDEAYKHFRQALKINPDYADAHFNYGNVLAANNRLDEAIPHFSRAAALKPDDAVIRGALGKALALSGRMTEALAATRTALLLAERQNNAALARVLRARIAEYEAKPR